MFKKYDPYDLFLSWATEDQCVNYSEWKCALKNKINTYENCLWETYVKSHLHLSLLHQTFSEIWPINYWTITSSYPDLVPKLNIQLILMVDFGLQSGLPWLRKENIDKCLFRKTSIALFYGVLISETTGLLKNFLIQSNELEGEILLLFLRNLSDTCRLRFLTNGLKLPFSRGLCVKVQKFVAASVLKIYRIRLVLLEETHSRF